MSDAHEANAVRLYAGFWRRAAAATVDFLVLLVPALLTLRMPDVARLLVQLAVIALYYALMHSSPWQASLGKRAFGIKVVGTGGQRITFVRALARTLAGWLSVALAFIGVAMAAFTARKQALHDLIAGTLVVNRASAPQDVAGGGGTMKLTVGVLAMAVVLVGIPICGVVSIEARKDYVARSKAKSEAIRP